MSKVLASKWGKWVMVLAFSVLFFAISTSLAIAASNTPNGGATVLAGVGAILLYFAIPFLYLLVVIRRYFKTRLPKYLVWLLFAVFAGLAIAGIILLMFMAFRLDSYILRSSYGQVYCVGFLLGSLISFALLYFDFAKMGYAQENAEKRSPVQNIIVWGVFYILPPFLYGFMAMLVRIIGQTWLMITLATALIVLTLGSIVGATIKYGLPLGSKKEQTAWIDDDQVKHQKENVSKPLEATKEDVYDAVRYGISYQSGGAYCEVSNAKVKKVGFNSFDIWVQFKISNASHVMDESYKDPELRKSLKEQCLSTIKGRLFCVSFELHEMQSRFSN